MTTVSKWMSMAEVGTALGVSLGVVLTTTDEITRLHMRAAAFAECGDHVEAALAIDEAEDAARYMAPFAALLNGLTRPLERFIVKP